MTEQALRQQVCDVGRRLWDLGLVGACEGNISCRLSDDRLLITPKGRPKGLLRPEEIVVVDLDGIAMGEGDPSSEILMHLVCYRIRPDCQCVVHAHPPHACALALAQRSIPNDILMESAAVLGPVALAPFALPGTQQVPDSIAPLLPNHKSFLIANHGATVLGRNLWDSCWRMETLERVAMAYVVASGLGGAVGAPDSASSAFDAVLNGKL